VTEQEQLPVGLPQSQSAEGSALVVRSAVPADKPYKEYRPFLRRDFLFSCAYCTMSEAEAQAIRMTIDHYEPRSSRPDLENVYENLMYACDECNLRKGDRCPPSSARANGHRFFRPDSDRRSDHFVANGIRLDPRTSVGSFSIEAIDLNRMSLRRLREIRERLLNSWQLAHDGILGLKSIRIDQLPRDIRGRVLAAKRKADEARERIEQDIDAMLSELARSPLLDDEEESSTTARRGVSF